MAEELTIDTSTLTKTAVQFGKGMNAFLDTEMEYIQYLRNRNGAMGGGGSGMAGARNLVQLDYAKKWHHPKFGGVRLPSMPTQRIKPNRGFPRSKLNRFNQQRMTRRIYNQLRKMGLQPNQVDEYLRLKNLGYNHTRAMEGARRLKPLGNALTRPFTNIADDFKRGFQRPDWLTRKNWGALRPGVRERAWNWLTKVETGVGNNRTLQPRRWVRWLGKGKNFLTKPFKNIKIPGFMKGGLLTALTLIPDGIIVYNMFKEGRWKDASRHIIKTGVNYAVFNLIFGVTGAAAVLKTVLSGGTLTGPAIAVLIGGTIAAGTGGQIAEDITDKTLHWMGLHDDGKVTPKFAAGRFITGKFNNGAVITSPTRGMIGGTKALVGEANEAEIILPMSKIGDAISAVYREGASIMVGATLSFLGPLAGGPAVASLLSEAKRIGELVGADTDVKVATIKLPEAFPAIHSNKVNNKEDVSEDTEFTSNKTDGQPSEGSHVSTVNRTSESGSVLTGPARWQTILPHGEPAFSSPFGMRWGRMHRGIDIGVWENNPVHAQEAGVVESIIPKFGEYGGAVVVSHPDGTANLYGHVYDYVVKPGQKVERGDPLAKIIYYPGSDGSNQSHLHFERFNKSGTRIDPLPYFQQGGASIDAQTDNTGTVDGVNQGGPVKNTGRDISSSFVNMGSTLFNQNKQELIDTPVSMTNVGDTSSTLIPIPVPFPVPINKYITLPAEGTNNETKMVIDVFGKGASRS